MTGLRDRQKRDRERRILDAASRLFRARGYAETHIGAIALEAGFGSYAQFHRVYRKFLGTAPREVLSGGARSGIPGVRGALSRPGHSLPLSNASLAMAEQGRATSSSNDARQ